MATFRHWLVETFEPGRGWSGEWRFFTLRGANEYAKKLAVKFRIVFEETE